MQFQIIAIVVILLIIIYKVIMKKSFILGGILLLGTGLTCMYYQNSIGDEIFGLVILMFGLIAVALSPFEKAKVLRSWF